MEESTLCLGSGPAGSQVPLHLPGRTTLALLPPGRMGPIVAMLQLPEAPLGVWRGQQVRGPVEEASIWQPTWI